MNKLVRACFVILAFLFMALGRTQAAETSETQVIVPVHQGEWLAKIARQHGRQDYLNVAKESGIKDPDHIEPKWPIVINTRKTTDGAVLPEKQTVVKTHDADDHCVGQSNSPFQIGLASWYGAKFSGTKTASGEAYDMHALTVAHPWLPFGTEVCVQNTQNGKTVVARVNDRFATHGERVVNLSYETAKKLGMLRAGIGTVCVTVLEVPKQKELRKTKHKPPHPKGAAPKTHVTATDRTAALLAAAPPGPTPGYVDRKSARAEFEFPLSEVVLTPAGPAHVFDGKRQNRIDTGGAIARLFPEATMNVRTALLESVTRAEYTAISLEVGDRLMRMLTAEGDVYENVLEAQQSDAGLPAICFAHFDGESGNDFLLIREVRSGNWYGERIQNPQGGGASCVRPRKKQ